MSDRVLAKHPHLSELRPPTSTTSTRSALELTDPDSCAKSLGKAQAQSAKSSGLEQSI